MSPEADPPPNFTPEQLQTLSELSYVFSPTTSKVADDTTLGDVREYLRLIRQYNTPPAWAPNEVERVKRTVLLRRIRAFERPTDIQVALKRIVGIGLLVVVGVFGASEAQQALMNYHLAGATMEDLGHALGAVNILNIPQTMKEISMDFSTIQTATINIFEHTAKSAAATLGELLILAKKPWTKPKRRGFFF